ncbi:hypothetical protein, partial [Bacteroides fluxus]
KAGRPESGKVRGIGFEHRQEVIENVIGWWADGYLVTEEPTSIKALVDWAMEKFLFLSKKDRPLSYNTIRQEFGEIWRDLQPGNIKGKETKTAMRNKKILRNNLK